MRRHSTAFTLILAATLVSTLAACGQRETRVVSDPTTGETVTIRTGASAIAAPANLPDFAPLYPGARIESAMESNGGENQKGGMVSFRTPDAPDKVASFYRARLDASALTERNTANLNGTIIMSGAAPDDSDRGVQISIASVNDEPGTYVTLVYNFGAG